MKGAGFGVGEPLSSHRTLAQAGLEREASEKRWICLEVEVGLGLSGPDELPDPISWQLERSREKTGERKVSRELIATGLPTDRGGGTLTITTALQWIRLSALPGWELDTLPWQHGSDCMTGTLCPG